MDEFEAKLQLLIDIVSEKNIKLEQVLNITTNQETLLKIQDAPPEISTLITEMSAEKQKIIEAVIEGDEVFNNIFGSLEDFEENAPRYKETVRRLQAVVKIAADMDVNIRIAEEKNKGIIASKRTERPAVIRGGKQDLLNKYKKSYKKEE